MKFILISLLAIVLNISLCVADFPKPTAIYANHKTLIEPDIYDLYWNVVDNEQIEFEVHVKNADEPLSWLAFGISSTGGTVPTPENTPPVQAPRPSQGVSSFRRSV